MLWQAAHKPLPALPPLTFSRIGSSLGPTPWARPARDRMMTGIAWSVSQTSPVVCRTSNTPKGTSHIGAAGPEREAAAGVGGATRVCKGATGSPAACWLLLLLLLRLLPLGLASSGGNAALWWCGGVPGEQESGRGFSSTAPAPVPVWDSSSGRRRLPQEPSAAPAQPMSMHRSIRGHLAPISLPLTRANACYAADRAVRQQQLGLGLPVRSSRPLVPLQEF
jgi:hypothetical protein